MLDILKGRSDDGDRSGPASTRRPVIGIALGGGAARGFAHIGIMRTLIANGIVPNVVVGTSIGAVIGGAYATGHLDTLEQWARSLQARKVLSYLDIRLNGSGLIGGAKLAAELAASIGETRIEDLPLKYAAVATEIWRLRGGECLHLTSSPPGRTYRSVSRQEGWRLRMPCIGRLLLCAASWPGLFRPPPPH